MSIIRFGAFTPLPSHARPTPTSDTPVRRALADGSCATFGLGLHGERDSFEQSSTRSICTRVLQMLALLTEHAALPDHHIEVGPERAQEDEGRRADDPVPEAD